MTYEKNDGLSSEQLAPARGKRLGRVARAPKLMSPDEKEARLEELVKASSAENTQIAYRSAVQHYMDTNRPLPANEDELIEYLLEFEDVLAPPTLSLHLSALSRWHVQMAFRDPTKSDNVKTTIQGIKRKSAHVPNVAEALVDGVMVVIARHLEIIATQDFNIDRRAKPRVMGALRDNALLQLGFFGAFRRSELVAIEMKHITWESGGIRVFIPRSKTDQVGVGMVRSIPCGNDALCPVTALRKWLNAAGITEGAVFRPMTKSGGLRERVLTGRSVANIIVERLNEIGVENACEYSGHSLRRGFATSAHQAGASFESLKKQGGWKDSNTVSRYIEEARQFQLNAGASILEQLAPKDATD